MGETTPAAGLRRLQAPKLQSQSQLSDHVASYVRELIMSGQVRPGEFVRLEKLAAELGVSATPVREGMLALRGEGFIQLVARRGFMVSKLSRKDVEDLFFVQAELAGELAARAARAMTDELLAQIESFQDSLESMSAPEDVDRLEELNHQFHRAINRCADSEKLSWFLGTAAQYAPRIFFGAIEGWQQASIRDHRAIIDALRAKDEDAARKAMQAHIHHAGTLLIKHLENTQLWE
jgi:DNA-binding GntR family transcriptional regulator